MVAEGRSAAAAQTFAGLAHELPGPVHAGTDEPPVSLDDFASDDHRFDISWSRPEHHDCHRVAEPIEMEGAHVDDGDIGLLAWGEAADLVVKTPHPRAVESRQSKHVRAGGGGRSGPALPEPMLGRTEDHTVPDKVTRSTLKQYRDSTAVTELEQFEGRGHSLTIDQGWEDVASAVLQWLKLNGV